jgi:hypothetical protein
LLTYSSLCEKGVIGMKEKTEKMIASKVVDLACNTVKNTVGKSLPVLAHEVEMPDSIKKEFMNKDLEA